ncbi:MAG: fatty acid desaturase [Bryobacterales bacterium]|nr:fatty acid desaturase [Bryobacterales bacterium]
MGSDVINLPNRNQLDRGTAIALLVLHAGAIAAPFYFEWKAVLVAFVLYWIAGGWGVCMGYHRLHTHRGFKCPLWLEYLLAVCGSLALEGGPISWVATHRIHHQKSDQPGDPHSPREGKFWSHMGWIIFGQARHNATRMMSKYAPDLAKHRFYIWLNNWHWVPLLIVSIGLTLWGGLPMLLWALCFRVVAGLHATWLVNSATHIWGSRRFATRDDSRNNWWVALLTFGEGWHNNHHAHPVSARHGLAWYEFDITYYTLKALESVGLVRNLMVARIDEGRLQEREVA